MLLYVHYANDTNISVGFEPLMPPLPDPAHLYTNYLL